MAGLLAALGYRARVGWLHRQAGVPEADAEANANAKAWLRRHRAGSRVLLVITEGAGELG